MTYLFLGGDNAAKDKKISELKKKILSRKDSLEFDFEILHGTKLPPDILKKSLMTLPVLASVRLMIIRSCQKLNTQNKKILLDFLDKEMDHVVLVLDGDGLDPQSAFVRDLKSTAQVVHFASEEKYSVFDMTRAISIRQPQEALKILSQLVSGGDHPLQIMGALVWFWGKSKSRITQQQFREGLKTLQEADLNIKRSRLKPEHAVELAVIKLSNIY